MLSRDHRQMIGSQLRIAEKPLKTSRAWPSGSAPSSTRPAHAGSDFPDRYPTINGSGRPSPARMRSDAIDEFGTLPTSLLTRGVIYEETSGHRESCAVRPGRA